jgi:DNA polymerase-4
VSSRREIEAHLRTAADTIAQRLRRRALCARGVRVKLKRSDFRIVTRQGALSAPTDVGARLFERAAALLAETDDVGPFRLVGLAAYDLASAGAQTQLELVTGDRRTRSLETTIDRLADRFGAGIVQRAANLTNDRGLGLGANLDFLDDRDAD